MFFLELLSFMMHWIRFYVANMVKRRFVRSIFFIVISVLILCTLVIWRQYRPTFTSKITDQTGKQLENSINSLEEVTLGNMPQWIQIRGNDTANPILLWLHGGPGSAQMPVSKYNRNLEQDFIVVHWDQRGAGKSNPADFNVQTMTFEQYVQDAHELTQFLEDKFNKDKIFLLGHSWGTIIGITLSQAYPEDYYAYIGVSQVVDNQRAQQIAYDWLHSKIQTSSSVKDKKKLLQFGEAPYSDHEKYVRFNHMIDLYGGGMDVSMFRLVMAALPAREYRLSEFVQWLNGANRGSGPMWTSYISWNAFDKVLQVNIPVYFFAGENDFNTPLLLVQQYMQTLVAPNGKTLVVFKESAHTPFLKQTDVFREELVKVKNQTYPVSLTTLKQN